GRNQTLAPKCRLTISRMVGTSQSMPPVMENKNLTRFGGFRNAFRGALWLIRATGLRNSVGDLQQNFQQQHSKLSDITSKIAEIAKEQRRSKSLEAWRNSRDLRAFEKKVISQNGEDGII